MKKMTIGLCLLLAFAGWALAQNKKGNWLVGVDIGEAGYSLGHSESGSDGTPVLSLSDSDYFYFSVYPTIGYYFKDNLVLGAYVSLGYYSSKSESTNNFNSFVGTSTYDDLAAALGPFVRYYFGREDGKGRPFIHVYAQIGLNPIYKGKYTTSDGSGYTYKYAGYTPLFAGIQLGYEHYLNPSVGLQTYVGYSYSSYSYDVEYDYEVGNDPVYNTLNNSHGFSFGVGLKIHLSPEKK